MDDATRLASELIGKLKELNDKVCDYRQGLAHEFQRHSHHLLHDVPEHISARVEEVIAEELHNYPALGPEFALDAASADLGPAANPSVPSGRVSPPDLPPSPAGSGSSPDRGRERERDRDREFHGLFMPSYLPLLEVMQPNKSTSSLIAASPPVEPQDTESNGTQDPSPHVELDRTPPPLDINPLHPDPPSPVRANSEDSPSRRRRSALRRSSSASTRDIQSPRRVRFDVEGEEVLPTASPPTPTQVHPLPISPPPEFETMPIRQSLDHIMLEGETSILGDSPPPPKKISSTERLRALAKSSTEDVSKWTVVGNLQDDDDDDEGLVMFRPKSKSKAPVPELTAAAIIESSTSSHYIQDGQLRNQAKEIDGGQTVDKSEAANDMHGLPMPGSFKDEKRFSAREPILTVEPRYNPQPQRVIPSITKSSYSASISRSHEISTVEEEDMFGFDDEWGSSPRAAEISSKYIETELEEEEQIVPIVDDSVEGLPNILSPPPGIAIAKPAMPPPASPIPSFSRQPGASGSYRGKPFVIGVIRNEELYKKAAEMGDIGMFVGSVDGRSGVDPSDNYHFDGSPRSLGKRLLEEAHMRRNRKTPDRPEK